MTPQPEVNRALGAAENEGWPSPQSPRKIPMNPTIVQDTKIEDSLTRYGIVRVPVDFFHYRNYRYTNARDAIAQAQREQGSQGPAAPLAEAAAR